MASLQLLTPEIALGIKRVFTDIDDTLTTDGKLVCEAYQALWKLKEAGVGVVPVTGRPAGWCDLIARQWPVEGVVGENGALAFYEMDGKLVRYYHPDVAEENPQDQLVKVKEAVLREIQGSRVSKDQFARLYDLAIDFCEEAPDLGLEQAGRIAEIFRRMGAQAKISSIHVNGWYGNYDKLSMVKLFVGERWGLNLEDHKEEFMYCGDSPNDERMFSYFPYSCGVANVCDFLDIMTFMPTYICSSRGGEGFCELAEALLNARK